MTDDLKLFALHAPPPPDGWQPTQAMIESVIGPRPERIKSNPDEVRRLYIEHMERTRPFEVEALQRLAPRDQARVETDWWHSQPEFKANAAAIWEWDIKANTVARSVLWAKAYAQAMVNIMKGDKA